MPGRRGSSARPWLQLLTACSLLWIGGCHGKPDYRSPLYNSCLSDAECASGLCQEVPWKWRSDLTDHFCTRRCSGEGDGSCGTPDGLCRPGPAGGFICVERCERAEPGLYACVAGARVFCSQLDDTHCEDCGCPRDLRCDPGKGCIPKSDVGAACRGDPDCMSGNCSRYAHVCRVPLGMVCSAENCDACITSKDPGLGYSYCSRDCSVTSGCDGACRIGGDGWGLLHGTCKGPDDPSCPVPCTSEVCGGTIGWYCYCQNGCVVSSNPRPDGAFCTYSGQCAGGTCLQAHLPCQSSGFCLDSAGFCTGRCDAMSCGAGLACVELPSRGPVCLPTCDQTCEVGTCRTLASATGAEVGVCDVRVAEGDRCRDDTDCRSNRCANDVCVATAGLADGSSCGKDADCTSGSCRNGQCYGKAVIGEPCSGPYGCAAGTCCQSGPHPNTCQVNCS